MPWDCCVRRSTVRAEIGVGVLEFPIAASDADLAEIASAAGFTEAARLPGRIRDGQIWVDLRLFSMSLGLPTRAFHGSETYYANRQPWQVERIAEGSGKPAHLR